MPREPQPRPAPNPLRDAFFGDLHVHTSFSTDAYLVAVRATPDDAYRYARGEEIGHAGGFRVRLRGAPLDFLAVTDHGEQLGERALAERAAGAEGGGAQSGAVEGGGAKSGDPSARAWRETVAAAERHYEPGRFTTFAAYEYSSAPDRQNLHRNVIFRGGAAARPFTRDDSSDPEDLWIWMDALRAEGIEALAIPHNPNASNGLMFDRDRFRAGGPAEAARAERRMRNEPLVEVLQAKGASETHPLLSPDDPWADFELVPFYLGGRRPSQPAGSYVRDAYRAGLELEESAGFNPFKLGVIGSSDTHSGAGSYVEASHFGSYGRLDDSAPERGSVNEGGGGGDRSGVLARLRDALGSAFGDATTAWSDSHVALWGSGGLAGVWAEENTRESIYDALRRKETFATSGPRIRVRFFAGYGFGEELEGDPGAIARLYASGVPMGGDLVAAQGSPAPRFFAWAARDAEGAPLERMQIVKGWIEDGESRERLWDVACSDGLEPVAEESGGTRCPDNGARVDLSDCSRSEDRGAAQLEAVWTDPDFSPSQRAFYYLRVLENPTCRWSSWDAVRAGTPLNPALAPTIQERAWSSPIWYLP